MAKDPLFDMVTEESAFRSTFDVLSGGLGEDAFRRFDRENERFAGPFTLSGFEAIALGIGYNITSIDDRNQYAAGIGERIRNMWSLEHFPLPPSSGSGVRASSRIPRTVPFGRDYFRP